MEFASAPALFAAGALSSVGPCVAPRALALAACVAGSRRCAAAPVAAFLGGLTVGYAALAVCGSLLARLLDLSSWVNAALGAALLVAGAVSLIRVRQPVCPASEVTPFAGGAFLLGASFVAVASPCCTPVVVALVLYGSALGAPSSSAWLLACFALGHALPLLLVGTGAARLFRFAASPSIAQASSIVAATLMLAVGMLYVTLA